MPATKAQIAANRSNAQKSTGPKSAAGKARSRLNAITHGLRSEEVVTLDENPEDYAKHLAAWVADWKPCTMARAHLVERLAIHSWKLKRCTRIDAARMRARQNDACEDFDQTIDDDVQSLVDRLGLDPAAVVDELAKTQQGLNVMIGMWEGLHETMQDPAGWTDRDLHHRRFVWLQGLPLDDPAAAEGLWISRRLLLSNDPTLAADDAEAKLAAEPLAPGELESAVRGLRNMIKCKHAQCQVWAAKLTVDIEAVQQRDEAVAFAAHEVHAEDEVLRRHESRLERSFRADMKQLMDLMKSGLDLAADSEDDDAPIEPAVPQVESAKADPPQSASPTAPPPPVPSAEIAPDASTPPPVRPMRNAQGKIMRGDPAWKAGLAGCEP